MTVRVFLYDAGGHDREVEIDKATLASLEENNLLWIDVDSRDGGNLTRLATSMGLPADCLRRAIAGDAASLDNYGDYFRFSVDAAPQHDANGHDGSREADHEPDSGGRIDFITGGQWLVTVHDGPILFLDRFRDQDKAETMIGLLSPQALAASLLDWHLGAFFEEVSRIETTVDKLDERVLREPTGAGVLGRMVAMRRRVSRLRALLVRQREVFYGLSRPDFALITDAGATPFYEALARRFERALDEVERARDLVTGSFELFTSRSSQQTNDLVKVLTFLTAIIGFCAAVAGLLGMNFELAFFRTGLSGFLIVTGSLALTAVSSLAYARRRNWI